MDRFESACYELPLQTNAQAQYAPPTELLLAPVGEFMGRDGRTYRNTDPEAVINKFEQIGMSLPVDADHTILHRGGPAIGWINRLENRNGEIWATKIDWLDEGVHLLASKKYRYYSPVYLIDDNSRVIEVVDGMGLTNSPNLTQLSQLNQSNRRKGDMNLQEELNAALKNNREYMEELAETNNEKARLQSELNSVKAEKEQLGAKLKELEDQQADAASKAFSQELNSYLDGLSKDGKLPPAQKELYGKTIRSTEELNSLKELFKNAPNLLPDGKGKEGTESKDGNIEFNSADYDAQELELAKSLGLEASDLAGCK